MKKKARLSLLIMDRPYRSLTQYLLPLVQTKINRIRGINSERLQIQKNKTIFIFYMNIKKKWFKKLKKDQKYDLTFLLSQPRSGSTLLRLHLGEMPGVVSLPETHFFPFISRFNSSDIEKEERREQIIKEWTYYHTVRKMNLNLKELEDHLFEKVESWKDLLEETIDFYLKANDIKTNGNLAIIEKSPPHIFFQKDIESFFPSSRKIFLIRDPRSVICSLKNMAWSTSNIVTLSRSWRAAARSIKVDERSLCFTYEGLVNDPKQSFQKLADFFEVEADWEGSEKIVSDPTEEKNWNSAEVFNPINTSNIDKWRDQLSETDEEPQVIESICREEMLRFGYNLENKPKTKKYIFTKISHYLHFSLMKLFTK